MPKSPAATSPSRPLHLKVLGLIAPKLAKTMIDTGPDECDLDSAAPHLVHMQSPFIEVPPLTAIEDTGAASLRFPEADKMFAKIATICMSGVDDIQAQAQNPDTPADPSAYLGLHPDISVSKALHQITGAAFPDDTVQDATDYFVIEPAGEDGQAALYREERLRYVFTLLAYIDGDHELAQGIEARLSLPRDILTLRQTILQAKSQYDPHAGRASTAEDELPSTDTLDALFDAALEEAEDSSKVH